MQSVKDLIAQREALEKKIRDVMSNERQSAIVQVRELIGFFNITPAELQGKMRRGRKAAAGNGDAAPTAKKTRRTSPTAGKKVEPKYRNPKTGQTWSGRGLKPRWLAAEIEAGKKLQDFAV